MKGFESSDWEIKPYHKNRDRRWYVHEKFPFLKISCRKEVKGSKSKFHPRDPIWTLEIVPWNREVKGRYKRNYVGKWNTKLLGKFFDDFIKTGVGRHIVFNYLFGGRWDL